MPRPHSPGPGGRAAGRAPRPAAPAIPSQPRPAPRSKGLRAAGIVAGCLLALIAVAYAAGCVYFTGRLWPNTSAKGYDLSLMTRDEAVAVLERAGDDIDVHVSGQGVDFHLTSENSGIALNAGDAVDAMLAASPAWTWPAHLVGLHDGSGEVAVLYSEDGVRAAVENALATFNATASDPVDASVVYDEASGAYVVDPGAAGTKLDAGRVAASVLEALAAESGEVLLDGSHLVQQAVTADDATLQQAAAAANAYLACRLDLTLNGTPVATLDGATVRSWIVFGEGGAVSIDDAQLVAWVDGVEALVDNVGGTRSYTRPDGKYATVTGGTYGWISDGAAIESIVRDAVSSGTVGSQEVPCKQTAAVYNPGGQDWGARYLDIDLAEQHVRLYGSDGSLLWESDCITGSTLDGHDTPTGVYYLNDKATDQTLVGEIDPATGQPEYESAVSYWMPFVGNSVGLHDATWQTNGFGGTLYAEGYGSHGCVNLPYDAAAELYNLIEVGDVVVVHG